MAREALAPQCGAITYPSSSKKEINVVRRSFSTFSTIYNIDNDKRCEGPPLPKNHFWGATVPVGKTFFVVGGSN